MEAPVTSRSSRIPHRLFARASLAPGSASPQPVGTWIIQALWLGLASGWLESGVIFLHRITIGTVTRGTIRLNWYHVPLGLLAHLAIFAAGAAFAAMLSNRWTRRVWRDPLVTWLGWFLAVVSPLLVLEELHWLSSVILAAAMATYLARWWIRHRGPILRWTLPPLALASALIAGSSFALVRSSEGRALAALPAARPGAPNVVLLVLDTVRADHLSLYGYRRPTTPRLEALADRSIRFDFARSAAPWTLPSHATMFTGRWPHELSVDYDQPLDSAEPTVAEFLADRGYLTGGFVGNTFYCNSWFGVDRGFARYEDSYPNRTASAQEAFRSAAITRRMMPLAVQLGIWPTDGEFPARKHAEAINRDALAWLDRRAGDDRPFFLFLNYIDAHGPYVLPEGTPRAFSHGGRLEMLEANQRVNRADLPAAERLAAVRRFGFDAYDDCIRHIDEQIDRLLAELERRGKRRDTWVIVTADHGEHFGERGLFRHGNSLYRPLINVPLVVIPPEGSGLSGRVSAPVSLRDLPATIADLTGLASASPFPGHSLRHHWDSTAEAPSQVEAPYSELKVPSGMKGYEKLPDRDRQRTAFVDQGRIYHRDPLGPESLYDLADGMEVFDLAPLPGEAPALEHFRDLGKQLRDGDHQ